MKPCQSSLCLRAAVILILSPGLRAATNQVIYDDALENGWQFGGWATTDLMNPAPVHAGQRSIKLNENAWEALYLHNGNARKAHEDREKSGWDRAGS
jgi:hypothetical protein